MPHPPSENREQLTDRGREAMYAAYARAGERMAKAMMARLDAWEHAVEGSVYDWPPPIGIQSPWKTPLDVEERDYMSRDAIDEKTYELTSDVFRQYMTTDTRDDDNAVIRQMMLASQMVPDGHWRLAMLEATRKMVELSARVLHYERAEAMRLPPSMVRFHG